MLDVTITELPRKISMYDAVDACYAEQIRFIWSRARDGMSVLVRCNKQIVPYLQALLKKRLASEGKTVAIIDGRFEPQPAASGMPTTRIAAMIVQLRNLLHNTEPNKVFFLPYLDIITSTVVGGLSQDGKEIMTIIHENPMLVRIAFEDPDFPLPEIIAQAFPARIELLGLPRHRFARLITAEEGNKFGREHLNLMSIYKYVSGLNPIRLREIMAIFAKKSDFDPGVPGMLEQYLQELRSYTVCGGVSLSHINLARDIAGYEKVKEQINDNILSLLACTAQLSDEKEIRALEAIIPRGIILYGPPGTGKTLFAKGIAEALNASVTIVSGPELKSKWVGEGEANIRRVFAQARATAPAVIVFDELDSIAAARTGGGDSASQASHSMVNQLLTEMDGFRKEELVLVIGTTNFPDSLDPAFLRPGRFEFQIEIPYPESADRRAILALYNNSFTLGLNDMDLDFLAEWTGRMTDTGTPYSGDHLNALMRSFKRRLIATGQDTGNGVLLRDWLAELHPRTRLERSEERVVAIHEIGHLLMFARAGRLEDIQKVTLESGAANSLGYVESRSRRHGLFFTETQLRDQIGICLGGYAAERIVFSEVSTGASLDLRQATAIAQEMVALHGMGKSPFPRHYGDEHDQPNPYYLPTLSPRIDELLAEALLEAVNWLSEHQSLLEQLAELLQDHRTLTPERLRQYLDAVVGR